MTTKGTFISRNDPAWSTRSAEVLRRVFDGNGLEAYATDGELVVFANKVFDEPTRLYNLDPGIISLKVIRIAKEMIRDEKIGFRAHIRDAVKGAFQLVPEYQETFSGAKWAVEAALDAGLYHDTLTGETLAPFIRSLGKDGRLPLSESGKQQKETARADQWRANERARLIQSITQGKDSFKIYGKPPGGPSYLQTFPASSLDDPALTLQKLRELDAAAADVRRKDQGTREENRTELRDRATSARGYEVFREGDSTSLESRNLPEGLTSASTDRSVPIPESAKQIFISPRTGRFYSRAELYELAGSNRTLFRTLMRTNNSFLNQLLAEAN